MQYWALWGKTRRGIMPGDDTHALIHHMVDAGAAACTLWERVVSEALRRDLCNALGLGIDEAGRALAWLASLHDLGKASPAFQVQYAPAIPALKAAGLRLEPQASIRTHHSAIGRALLMEVLPALTGAPAPVVRGLAAVIGGHHGTWQCAEPKSWELGDDSWACARRDLVSALTDLFGRPCPRRWPSATRGLNALLATLAGLVTIADWFSSMAEWFPCRKGPSDLGSYLATALGQAREAAGELLPERLAPGKGASFGAMFPFGPNAIQQAAINLARELEGPALVIVEAPTGSGKTEAALYLAEQLRGKAGGGGAYVAMPTVTTSNQMHARALRAFSAAHPDRSVRPLLVHGQAIWESPPPNLDAGEDEQAAAVDPMGWFLPRKRALLAPYGVGTVDQALLAVLPTTYFYLRLYGLARKTVIFDEVHAYDTYMSRLFERLLEWLQALGCSVIILSATLPASTRQRLLAAYGGQGAESVDTQAYPAIRWCSPRGAGMLPLPTEGPEREVHLRWIPRDRLVEDLRGAIAGGGCAAVICNTVARAQETYTALKAADLVPPSELYLFHARYPQGWRESIEQRVLERFGKDRRRGPGERAILVATQVVEQSLDLDFDYMVSDLAPVDLLIQRAGRLHRHPRGANERPAALRSPQLTLLQPPDAEDELDRADEAVYDRYLLLRTRLALEGRSTLRTPSETSALIAAVYDSPEPELADRPALRAALQRARERFQAAVRSESAEAEARLVEGPDSRYAIGGSGEVLYEDDPAVHRSLQALTRLAEPTVRVVCVHRRGDELHAAPEGGTPLCWDRPDDEVARELARCTVSVTHRGAVFALLAQAAPEGWARHPFLRHCRLAVFADGTWPIPGSAYVLRLTRELGLQVCKEVS